MNLKIYYGTKDKNIDITQVCFDKLVHYEDSNILTIPAHDWNRAWLFGDPVYGTLKTIFIEKDGETTEYHHLLSIEINIRENTIITSDNVIPFMEDLGKIQSSLKIKHGTFGEELSEQIMSIRYLTGNEKVLELGANIGRNSLIIASILKKNNNNNFVAVECDTNISKLLLENRELNGFDFHIENSAISKRKLIQKGWKTIPSDVLLPGYNPVNTITISELKQKYNIDFDTLVLDCEGAFFYILMDMPEIMENINLVITENDYLDINHKLYVENVFKSHNLKIVYIEPGGFGPCTSCFFEVWKKV